MSKKSLWSHTVLAIQVITILIVFGVIWQSSQPVQDAGDGIALGIFAAVIVMPLYLISTILVLIFHRTKKHIILTLIPLLLIAGMMLYDRVTHISYFDPADYQYLIGKNISEAEELFQKASGGTGETAENNRKGYILPGMILWVDKDGNIVTINSDN